MTETRQTTNFAFLFFLYFFAVSLFLAFLPLPFSASGIMLFSQLLSFLPPVLLYFVYTKKSIKETLHLQPLHWKNVLLIIAFSILLRPFISLLSYASSLFFPNPVEQSAEPIFSSGFLLSFLSIAIVPALFEEIFSRGILLSGYRFLGKGKALFFSALLFGMLHMNPQQFPYAFVVGCFFCFLVERTGSLYASILLHFLINSTTVLGIFAESGVVTPIEMEVPVVLFSLTITTLFTLPLLFFLLILFLKINPPAEKLCLMDENGMPYRESICSPSLICIFVFFFLFGLLPYFYFPM